METTTVKAFGTKAADARPEAMNIEPRVAQKSFSARIAAESRKRSIPVPNTTVRRNRDAIKASLRFDRKEHQPTAS